VEKTSTFEKPAKANPVILQVLPSLVTGGVERGTVDLARAITESGGTALVASSGGVLASDLGRFGAKHITLPVHSKNPIEIHRNIYRLSEVIRDYKINLIHARSRAPAWSCYYAAQRMDIPFVTTFHGNYSDGNFLKHFYNSIMTRGDRVIAISEFIAQKVVQEYRVNPDKVITVPRGVDLDFFDPAAVSDERLRKLSNEWQIPECSRIILLPGRLTEWKGQRVLIEAIAKIRDKSGLCVILAGSAQGRDHYLRDLRLSIDRLGLSETIRLVGDCRDMAAAMLLADVVVSCSVEAEAFGRVIIEGQAMGRLVIGTDHGGAKETICEGETGWLVSPGNSGDLARCLEMVLSLGEQERIKIAHQAMKNVRKKYTRDQMCELTLAIYRDLVSEVPAEA
jgi:glycosyltransferase involved in cell wall biosynthesis